MANENIFLADKEKIAVLQEALRIAAQYARDNLPSKLPKDMNYTYGVYLTYEALKEAIEEVESMDSYCEVYNYDQVSID